MQGIKIFKCVNEDFLIVLNLFIVTIITNINYNMIFLHTF